MNQISIATKFENLSNEIFWDFIKLNLKISSELDTDSIRIDRLSNSEEFDHMWSALANHKINFGLTDPTVASFGGSFWEYRGTDWNDRDEKYFHLFSHEAHPNCDFEPVNLAIPAKGSFFDLFF